MSEHLRAPVAPLTKRQSRRLLVEKNQVETFGARIAASLRVGAALDGDEVEFAQHAAPVGGRFSVVQRFAFDPQTIAFERAATDANLPVSRIARDLCERASAAFAQNDSAQAALRRIATRVEIENDGKRVHARRQADAERATKRG